MITDFYMDQIILSKCKTKDIFKFTGIKTVKQTNAYLVCIKYWAFVKLTPTMKTQHYSFNLE